MKRLILIRHAKSGWDDPMADDHDRVLTERGRTAAKSIGEWLAAQGYVPDVMLVSDAARTVETHRHICDGLGQTPKTSFHPTLYHAAPDTILDLAMRQPDETIAVIAHNPGIAMAAHGLVRTRPRHSRFSDYPTCATTVIDFEGDIRVNQGTCIDFTVPRDLTD
ncbi:phosphohistidine phosphatase [Cognatiyoonia koreensis]|uniref:Phosphohistidine phosphatase n=1 Tax=Cognatiyoonia koreensis TaxID=364200 RepID=A0A1I0RZU8_9RHOB|nr:histidine phosphatase family protein [Cognatiyoonia koreensis]SEW47376.1 phosphohistidine phosphatase [Cognatiyoonia koreensis]